MTSSLVGSEMCIRDRVRRDLWGGIMAEHAPCGFVCPWGTKTLPPAYPVSYTHLTLPTICSV
eukprot:3995824-Prorocentrum_lima.AAC.1